MEFPVFVPVDAVVEDDEPDGPDTTACRCQKIEGIWKLTIEEGAPHLVHSVCGKVFPDSDLMETVVLEETEVLLSFESDTVCQCYGGCDCDYSVVLTLPR